MATYITATGLILPVSQAPENWPAGTTAAETQLGTAANDVFQGAGGDLLIGGAGDDAYYLWDSASSIVEQSAQGIDTVYAKFWGAVTLPDYVDNLFLDAVGATSGTGNALNNIIVAGTTGATLDGAGGDDVLVGGSGADLFKIAAGNGSDAIVNFKPSSDVIKLQGYGITSFDQLKSLGVQVGADVQFSFANGEKLVVRDVSLSDLSAYDFGLPPALAPLQPGYSEMVGPSGFASAHGWSMVNNVWNASGLAPGDYSTISSYKASDLTDHPTFNWSFPVVTEAIPTVRAYPEISFGPNPLNDMQIPVPGAVFPIQLSALSGLTADYDVAYQGNMDGFDVAFDIWLTSQPNGGASTITNEVMIWVHKGGISPFGDLIGTYQDGAISAHIYHGANHGRPYTAVILDTDLPAGSINVNGILDKLQGLGVVSSSEYLASIELGAEVASGAGSLTINNLDLHVKTTSPLGAVTSTTVTGTGTSSTVTNPGTTEVPVIGSFSPDTNVLGDGLTKADHITLKGGAAIAGSAVEIYDGSAKIGTAITGADHAWSFTTGALAEGTHVFTSKMIDAAGNVSAASAPLNVTVDTASPAAPALLSITPDSNVVGDGITNVNQITLNGAATPGASIEIFESGNQIGTAVANSSGIWSFATAVLDDGNYAFTSKARDDAGNLSVASGALNVTVDTLAPNKPSFTGIAPDGHVIVSGPTNVNHITLEGAALPNSTIKIFDGPTQIGTATVDSSGIWSFVAATLADGSHSLTSKTMDAAGNLSMASAALNISIDTVKPDAPALLSFSPDSNVAGDGITNVSHITLNGAAAAGGTVKIFDGTTLIGSAIADSSGIWSFGTAALADGNHTFTGKAVDAAGNLSAASGALRVTVDTVAPNKPGFSAFAPDGHLVTSGDTNISQITLKGGAAANTTIKIFDDSTQIGTAAVDSSGAWSFVTGTLADGSHSLTSKAMDAAGNISAASTALNVTVDTVSPAAPALLSFSPDSNVVGDGITNADHITLNGAAAAGGTVKIFDGTTQIGTAVANSSGVWSFATATLADGNHTFTGKAIDAAGNLSAASGALKVTVDTVAPNAPGFSTFAPDGHLVTSGATNANQVTLKGGAAANTTIKIFDGAAQIGTAAVDSTGAWSFVTATLADGSHSLTSKTMDAAGNISTASAALNLAVDTVSPDAPALLSFSPDSNVVGDGITNADHITLNGAAAAGGAVKIFDGTTQIGTAVTDSSGIWSFATATLADGNHTFTGKAIDAAGNLSTASGALKVTVDTVAPNAPGFSAFAPDGHLVTSGDINVSQMTLKGGAAANTTVEIFDGSSQIGTVAVDSSGAWSFVTGTLADGSHSIASKDMDKAGNLSSSSAALNITVATASAPSASAAMTTLSTSADTANAAETAHAPVANSALASSSSANRAFVFAQHLAPATGAGTMSDLSAAGVISSAATIAPAGAPNDIQSGHLPTDFWHQTDAAHDPGSMEMLLAALRHSDFQLH